MSHCERFGRRRFLRNVSTLALTPMAAVYGGPADSRSLSFVHTHTGETLSTIHFRGGDYGTASLKCINYLLRDFRTEEVHAIDPKPLDLLFEPQGATHYLVTGLQRGGVGFYTSSDIVQTRVERSAGGRRTCVRGSRVL